MFITKETTETINKISLERYVRLHEVSQDFVGDSSSSSSIASNLGQNFISNTDWIIKRDLVNLKYEVSQLRKEFNESIHGNGDATNIEKKNESMNMVNRIKSEENSFSKSSAPLSLDAIRQSNLQNRDSYYRSTNSMSSNSVIKPPYDEVKQGEGIDSPKNITLTTGVSVPAVRLDKTNILLVGPTGCCRIVFSKYNRLRKDPNR